MRLLLIEPNRLYRQVVETIVRDAEYEAVSVNTGKEGLEALEQGDFDIACVAMNLSDMTCIEFARQIHAHPNQEHFPILMLTSEEDRKTLEDTFRAGVTEIFSRANLQALDHYIRREGTAMSVENGFYARVLYVEDCILTAAVYTELLKGKLNVAVDHYVTGEEALAAFEMYDYDLVLTDVMLEGTMTGTSLVRAIRDLKKMGGRVPILALSALEDTQERLDLLRSGVADYIAKPVLDEELLLRARNLITNKKLFDKVEEQASRLQQLAITDQITGLYNRYYLFDTVRKSITAAIRHGYPLSMLLLDLDHFKAVNDTYGHNKGDDVLRHVGKMLRESSREEDVAARFGGEEFVMILHHCDSDNAMIKGEELRKRLVALKPGGIRITGSIGVSSIPDRYCTFEDLFGAADRAVYRAKDHGRNRVESAMVIVKEARANVT